MTNKMLIGRIEKEIAALAKRRDTIREVMATAEEIEGACTKAIDSLQEAVFALSEVV